MLFPLVFKNGTLEGNENFNLITFSRSEFTTMLRFSKMNVPQHLAGMFKLVMSGGHTL